MTRVYVNANVYTADPERPRADAVAVRDGAIAAVGSSKELRKQGGEVIDLEGRTVVPGLIDAHAHTTSLGRAMEEVALRDVKNFDGLIERVVERARTLKPGDWIGGRGWNQEHWDRPEFPHHDALSKATPENPVYLRRVDGHAAIVNAKAMQLAGIEAGTAAPDGGEILRTADGAPLGVLVDRAMRLVEKVMPELSVEVLKRRILKAQEACLKAGLTAVHDAGVGLNELQAFHELDREGKIKIRFYLMVTNATRYWETNKVELGDRVTVRGIKMFSDGALGSRGAWLLKPYADRPTDEAGHPYLGLPINTPEAIQEVAESALEHGWQLCVHAIGTRANREVVNAFEAALKARPTEDHRFRVEHAQLVHPDDIPRFSRLGIIPSMQPTHATSDWEAAEKRLGTDGLAGAYAWKSFLKHGSPVAGGSDFPVESHEPLLGFFAAVSRRDASGRPQGGWLPEEKLSREEALRSFTLDAAYSGFEEKRLGSITPGKRADLLVLDRDLMTVPEDEILQTKVLRTIVDGEEV